MIVQHSRDTLLSMKDTIWMQILLFDLEALPTDTPTGNKCKLKPCRKGDVCAIINGLGTKLYMPSKLLENKQSLNNKVDKLCARTNFWW